MSFIWPVMLLFLLLVPLFVGLYIRLQQRRRRLAASYGSFGLVQGASGRQPGLRRHIPPALFLSGLAILLTALARPQTVVSLPRLEGTVILAFDVSGSMAAEDLNPTRMEAAKFAARDFIQRQPSTVQIGVVAFSDSSFTVQAPTNDQDAVLAAIDRLAPQRGTSLAQGIFASLNTIIGNEVQPNQDPNTTTPVPLPDELPEALSDNSAVIVLLTDGENNIPPDPFAAAQAAADLGVRIYTVGIGSAAGTAIQIEGFAVHTRLDEVMLQQISEITGGAYYSAENEQDLHAIYRDLSPQLVVKPEKMEVTSLFAGASILLLLVGSAFSLLWFNRLP